MANECPGCGEPLVKPFKSCKCGWRAPKKEKQPDIEHNCAWNDQGLRCTKYGHLSLGTYGAGPWYCQSHFADLMHWQRISLTDKPGMSIAVEEMRKLLHAEYRGRGAGLPAAGAQEEPGANG